jgi:hypothetical protein
MEHLGVDAEDEEQHPGLDAAAGEAQQHADIGLQGANQLVGVMFESSTHLASVCCAIERRWQHGGVGRKEILK